MDTDLDIEIILQAVKKAVFYQKNGKARTPNELTNNTEYAGSWCLVYIVPIVNSGDSNQAKKYTGITLNNIL